MARCSSRADGGYSPLQYAPELRRCEYQEPRSFVRRSILQRWMGHQLGSVSVVGSSLAGRVARAFVGCRWPAPSWRPRRPRRSARPGGAAALALLLGLLPGALGLLLAGGQVGFAAVQDVREPGQRHGGAPLQLQVIHVPHGVHDVHVADLELDVERGGRFADGPGGRGGHNALFRHGRRGHGLCHRCRVSGRCILRHWRGKAQRPEVHLDRQQVLAGLQVLLVVRTGAGEQAGVDLVEVMAAAHHSAELLAILGEADGAALGQFQALAHALHAHVDIAAVGQRRQGIGRLDAGLLPAQGGRVFVAGEVRNRLGLCGG